MKKSEKENKILYDAACFLKSLMAGSGKWKRRRQRKVMYFPRSVVLLQEVHGILTQ